MKRTHCASTPTKKHGAKRTKLEQIEQRVTLLLLLLQHNFQTLLEHTKKNR